VEGGVLGCLDKAPLYLGLLFASGFAHSSGGVPEVGLVGVACVCREGARFGHCCVGGVCWGCVTWDALPAPTLCASLGGSSAVGGAPLLRSGEPVPL
jgi:hypothetical protein